MSIQSPLFFLFVAVMWLVAHAIPPHRRPRLFLLGSYLFYATWGLPFLAVLLASTVVNFGWGAELRRRPTTARLWAGVVFNLGLLAVCKYLPPLVQDIGTAAPGLQPLARLAMPVGISFWTFQALSYLLDTYQGDDLAPTLTEFALYLAFWPTVLSGPVCRLSELLPQLRPPAGARWADVAAGLRRIVLGLFFKLVLAQSIARGASGFEGITPGFDEITGGWSFADAWLLAAGFGFQLLFDFAGYSHIVIGTARLFGIRLPENFDRPYLSSSPSIFWTRWHMSLSSWIRDYVFFPLATLRRARWWPLLALALSMTLFGLWHGARLTFLLWGLYHGLLLAAHRGLQLLRGRRPPREPPAWQPLATASGWLLTFALVCFGWLFFRANDLPQALALARAALSPWQAGPPVLRPGVYLTTAVVAGAYFCIAGLDAALRRRPRPAALDQALWAFAPLAYAVALVLIAAFSRQETGFVYFQF